MDKFNKSLFKKSSKRTSKRANKKSKTVNINTNKTNTIKLSSLDDFRTTMYYDDMVYDYKEKKISPDKITDKDIIDYMNKLNDFHKNSLNKEIEDIKEYAKLKNKINFQPITIEILRKKYWNSKTKKWKPIKYYYANGDYPNDNKYGPVMIDNVQDRNNREKVFYDKFTPNGNLIEKDMKDHKIKRYKDWLQSDKIGPYKYLDYNYKNKRKFFYLDGKTKYRGDNKEYKDRGLQICQGNYLSGNCVDGPSWIETDKKMYV